MRWQFLTGVPLGKFEDYEWNAVTTIKGRSTHAITLEILLIGTIRKQQPSKDAQWSAAFSVTASVPMRDFS